MRSICTRGENILKGLKNTIYIRYEPQKNPVFVTQSLEHICMVYIFKYLWDHHLLVKLMENYIFPSGHIYFQFLFRSVTF